MNQKKVKRLSACRSISPHWLLFILFTTAVNTLSASPLHDAAETGDIKLVKKLIDQGADIKQKDVSGNTVLHWAAYSGNLELVTFFLDAGIPVNATNDLGVTALILAEYADQLESAKLLIKHGADTDIIDSDGSTALTTAWDKGQRDFMKYLVANGADPNLPSDKPPLHSLAIDGDDEMVAWFIEHGANVEIRDGLGQTALHLAAARGYLPTVRALLDKSADINARTNEYVTPLYLAVQRRQIDTVQYLLDNGADVNAATIGGDTPTSLAQRFSENFGETYILEMLVKYGGKKAPPTCLSERDIQQMNRYSRNDRLVRYEGYQAKIFVDLVSYWEYELETPLEAALYDTAVVWDLRRHNAAPLVLFKDGCALNMDTGFIFINNVKPLINMTELIINNASQERIRAELLEYSQDKAAVAGFEKQLDMLLKLVQTKADANNDLE